MGGTAIDASRSILGADRRNLSGAAYPLEHKDDLADAFPLIHSTAHCRLASSHGGPALPGPGI